MDILEEIDETIKDKKGKWNYTPMREKNETDALIDQLLKEFSSESEPENSFAGSETYSHNDYAGYNEKTEMEERREYEQVTYSEYQKDLENNKQSTDNDDNRSNVDMTQIFSREDIANYEVEHAVNNAGYSEYNGSANDNYSGGGGFDDDYYDENDFNEDCENLSPDNLDEEEYAEFESFMETRSSTPVSNPKQGTVKRVLRMVGTAFVAAFTIIGIFSSGLYLLEKLEASPKAAKEDNKALKSEMTKVIYPIVGTQTEDFESADGISDEQITAISIWEMIINGNLSNFKNDDSNEIVIPYSKVEDAAKKLFGTDEEITESDIEISGVEVKYDKDKQGYVIPGEHDIYTLYPVVKSVSDKDGVYTVTAECFSDGPRWKTEKRQMPVKTVKFTIKKTDNYYNVLSAKTSE